MVVKINCIHIDDNVWCKNKNVKPSLFGLGARCCKMVDGKRCEYLEGKPRK